MKNNVYEFKKERTDGKEKGLQAKRRIDVDQPFDYQEVVSITGPEYVHNLYREGLAVLPKEDVRRNAIALLLKDVKSPTVTKVSGFGVADDYYYHIGHSWVNLLRGGWVRIGVDDFTSKVFGRLNAINLPSAGEFLMQGEVGWVMNRNGHQAPMQSPVSGVVFAVNDRIKEHPEITHKDPYGEGWLFILNPVSLEINKRDLYSDKDCFQWIENENRNLMALLGSKYERLAATGGEPIDDIFGNFPEIDWDRLVKIFLRT